MLEIDLGVVGGVTHEATAFASGKARGSNFHLADLGGNAASPGLEAQSEGFFRLPLLNRRILGRGSPLSQAIEWCPRKTRP